MRALVRNPGETILETDNIPGIDWETGIPLTSPYWAGGAYTLVQNYVPPEDPEEVTPSVTYTAPKESVETTVTTETVQEPEVVETPAAASSSAKSTTRSYGPIFDI